MYFLGFYVISQQNDHLENAERFNKKNAYVFHFLEQTFPMIKFAGLLHIRRPIFVLHKFAQVSNDWREGVFKHQFPALLYILNWS